MYVTAWRAWRLAKRRNDWFLASIHRKAIWENALMTACCEPSPNSRHGLWSCATRQWLADRYNPAIGDSMVVGEVRVLGKSVEWTEGWQSYQQMVLSLFLQVREINIPRSLLGYKFARKATSIVYKSLGKEAVCRGEHIPGGNTNSGWLGLGEDRTYLAPGKKLNWIATALAKRYDVDCSLEAWK